MEPYVKVYVNTLMWNLFLILHYSVTLFNACIFLLALFCYHLESFFLFTWLELGTLVSYTMSYAWLHVSQWGNGQVRCCYFARCFLCVWQLTLSWQRPRSYRNQSIDLQSKSRDWFLYHRDLRYERVNAATFEVNMINQSQDITKKQFQGRFKFQLTFATFFFFRSNRYR